LREARREVVTLDLKRRGTGEILAEENDAVDALVVEQAGVALRYVAPQFFAEDLIVFQANGENELFADHGALGPHVVCRENAEFLDRQRFKHGFDVFGIDVLPFLGDDHVLFAAAEVEMATRIELAEISGAKPAA